MTNVLHNDIFYDGSMATVPILHGLPEIKRDACGPPMWYVNAADNMA